MAVQRFYLPDGRGYIDYSVQDVDRDYANVVIAPVDETLVMGLGYVLREEITLGIELETDIATTTKRWFAYDAGACGGTPGMRIGNVNAGYATMEGAIRGLLREYVDVPGVVQTETGVIDDGLSSTYGYYEQQPVMISPWHDTDFEGHVSDAVHDGICEAGSIHVMTSSMMCDIVGEVARQLWKYHDIFSDDHTSIRMHVEVDTPYDEICGVDIIDENHPFEGMSLHLETTPSRTSVMPPATASISVVDVENAADASVLVGTTVVNRNTPSAAAIVDGLSVGLSVESFASEAKDRRDEEEFVSRLMMTLMNGIMSHMVTEFQSMIPSGDAWDDAETNLSLENIEA